MGAPSYKTHDPKGWGGDPRRGAAMGRGSIHLGNLVETLWGPVRTEPVVGKLYLRRIYLDSGGYDVNGTYFGHGEPLWWYANAEGSIDVVIRAPNREAAKKQALEEYPSASFFR